jgi:sortase A
VTATVRAQTTGPAHLQRRSILNLVAFIFLAGAFIMLGKSCWIYAKAQVAQVLMERAFDQSITSGKPVKAWSWADTYPVARISVPRLGASAIVLDGTSGEALAFGPGLMHETSAFGAPGTTVVAAHRDTHFRFLKFVEIGDVVEVTRNDALTFRYKVTALRIADWNQSGIDRHKNGFNLVLATCYPFDSITHGAQRYLVETQLIQ